MNQLNRYLSILCLFLFFIQASSLYANSLVTNSIKNDSKPSIACHSSEECMVVWEHHYSESDIDVYAKIVDNGQTNIVVISSKTHDESKPTVTYSRFNGLYIVVWQEEVSDGNSDIILQRFDSNGSKVGSAVTVANAAVNDTSPSISCKFKECIVVYEYEYSPSDIDIYAQRIDASSGTLINGRVAIANSSLNETAPDSGGKSLEFWHSYEMAWVVDVAGSSDQNIQARSYLINANGSESLSSIFTISDNPKVEKNPKVTCRFDDVCFYIWEYVYGVDDTDIYGRMLGKNSFDQTFIVTNSIYNEVLGNVADHDIYNHQFVVAWEQLLPQSTNIHIDEYALDSTFESTQLVKSGLGIGPHDVAISGNWYTSENYYLVWTFDDPENIWWAGINLP